jgi:hypothetical protein
MVRTLAESLCANLLGVLSCSGRIEAKRCCTLTRSWHGAFWPYPGPGLSGLEGRRESRDFFRLAFFLRPELEQPHGHDRMPFQQAF